MKTTISISVPDSVARALAERKQKGDVNVSAFCARAIERELARTIVDADHIAAGIERRSSSQEPVLFPKAGQ